MSDVHAQSWEEQEEQSKVNECDFTEEKQRDVWRWKNNGISV